MTTSGQRSEPVFAITADVHAGNTRFGMSVSEYLEPFDEFTDACRKDNMVPLISGDLFHHRNPRIETAHCVDRALDGLPSLIAAGNHDISSPSRANALYALRKYENPPIDSQDASAQEHLGTDTPFEVLNLTLKGRRFRIGRLHWPMLEQFTTAASTLKERLDEAANILLDQMEKAVGDKPLDILFGHAHLRDSEYFPLGPQLLAGRDLFLPAERVKPLAKVIALGHIHAPDEFYVGSTQPTDLGDTTEKRYLVVDTELNVTSVPLKTSKQVIATELVANVNDSVADICRGPLELLSTTPNPKNVILLLKVDAKTENPQNLAHVKDALAEHCYSVAISIDRPRPKRRTSELTEEQLKNLSDPAVALDIWFKNEGSPDEIAVPAKAKALELLEEQ